MTKPISETQKELRAKMYDAKLKDVCEGTKRSPHLVRKALKSITLDTLDVEVLKDIKAYFEKKEQDINQAINKAS